MEPIDVALFYGIGLPSEATVTVATDRNASALIPRGQAGGHPLPQPVPRTGGFPQPSPVPRVAPAPVEPPRPTEAAPGFPPAPLTLPSKVPSTLTGLAGQNGSAEKVSAEVARVSLPEGMKALRLGEGPSVEPPELPTLAPKTPQPITPPHDPAPMPPMPRVEELPVDPRVQRQLDAIEAHCTWLGKQLRSCQTSSEAAISSIEKLRSEMSHQLEKVSTALKTHWTEISGFRRSKNQLVEMSKSILTQGDEAKETLDKNELQIQFLIWKHRLMEYHILVLKRREVDPDAMKEARQYADYYGAMLERLTTGQAAKRPSLHPPDPSGS